MPLSARERKGFAVDVPIELPLPTGRSKRTWRSGIIAISIVSLAACASLVIQAVSGGASDGSRGVMRVRDSGEGTSLGILSRPLSDSDKLPEDLADYLKGFGDTPRLALDDGGRQLYLGSGTTSDSVCMLLVDRVHGNNLFTCPLTRELTRLGALPVFHRTGDSQLIAGIIPDSVVKVAVAGSKVIAGENAFFADTDANVFPEITVQTDAGTRVVQISPPSSAPPKTGT